MREQEQRAQRRIAAGPGEEQRAVAEHFAPKRRVEPRVRLRQERVQARALGGVVLGRVLVRDGPEAERRREVGRGRLRGETRLGWRGRERRERPDSERAKGQDRRERDQPEEDGGEESLDHIKAQDTSAGWHCVRPGLWLTLALRLR